MEWKEVCLGDIVSIKGGKRLPKGINLISTPNNHPYIRIRDLGQNKTLELNNTYEYVDDETQKSISRYIVNKDDILISIVGTIGLVAIIGNSLDGANLTENCVKLVNLKNADNNFIYYYLISSLGQNEIKSGIVGAVQPKLPIKNIQSIKINIPSSIEDQRRIANILSSLDSKIENNNKINANLEAQAAALFKSWFVDFEPFKDDEFVESELGMIPKGWKVDLLGSLIKTISGGTPSRKNEEFYSNGNFCWVKSKELCGGFVLDTEEKITENAIAKSSAKLLPEYSTLIAMYGATVGEYGIITKQMTCNQAICALLPNDNFPFTFLFMLAKNMKEQLLNMAVGSAQQNISQVIIKNIPITYDLNTIKKYHSIVKPLMVKIKNNTDENQRLSSLRDTLLPKLMSGEIDLDNIKL